MKKLEKEVKIIILDAAKRLTGVKRRAYQAKIALARLSLFSRAKFFIEIVIYYNISQLQNFGDSCQKHNLLIIKEIKF